MRLAAFAVVVLAAVALSGCGKAGRPLSPDPTPHPQDYPKVGPAGQPVPAKPNKDDKAMPPEWDQEDLQKAYTKQGAFIDPSARQRINASNLAEQNVSLRTTPSGRGTAVTDPNSQTYVDQPLMEPRQ